MSEMNVVKWLLALNVFNVEQQSLLVRSRQKTSLGLKLGIGNVRKSS